jgi:hypothetical protein
VWDKGRRLFEYDEPDINPRARGMQFSRPGMKEHRFAAKSPEKCKGIISHISALLEKLNGVKL